MKIVGVDYGDARTGIAVCDQSEFLASPVGVIHEHNEEKAAKKVAEAILKQNAELVVVGNPINMNGSSGDRSEKCTAFGDKLKELTGLEVVMWDERGTTITAHNMLNVTDTRGKKRKNVVDAVAATIILENYLNYRKNMK